LPAAEFVLRERGKHPGGSLRVTGLRRGTNILIVEPMDRAYCVSGFLHIELTDGGAPAQHVRLARSVKRILQVVRKDGAAVSGTYVDLVRPMTEEPVDTESRLVELQTLGSSIMQRRVALLLQRGWTDARGELELHGPPREELALRILGPGHQPIVLQEVFLDPALGPLRVEIFDGAALVGRVRPIEALRQFHPTQEIIDRFSRGEYHNLTLASTLPGLRLVRPSGVRHPTGCRVLFEEDGSFAIEGIPPGTWDLWLEYAPGFTWAPQAGAWEALQKLELRDGERRTLDLDLGHLMRGRLEGRILYRGGPVAQLKVNLRGLRSEAGGKLEYTGAIPGPAETDLDGRFSLNLVPGTYLVSVLAGMSTLHVQERAEVRPGAKLQQDFNVRIAKLCLRALAPDGKTPLPRVRLRASWKNQLWLSSVETGGDGWATFEHVPLGAVNVKTRPKHLVGVDPAKLGWDALEAALVDLGTIHIDTEAEEPPRALVPVQARDRLEHGAARLG
jgi:hypothetical protein